MTSLPVGQDQITGMDVIELVDLEATGEHRHVPAEQIDEHALARLEHRGEHRILGETPAAFEYVPHGQTPALLAPGRIAPEGSPPYAPQRAYQRRNRTVKLPGRSK